jgi:hypothetical protein
MSMKVFPLSSLSGDSSTRYRVLGNLKPRLNSPLSRGFFMPVRKRALVIRRDAEGSVQLSIQRLNLPDHQQ